MRGKEMHRQVTARGMWQAQQCMRFMARRPGARKRKRGRCELRRSVDTAISALWQRGGHVDLHVECAKRLLRGSTRMIY